MNSTDVMAYLNKHYLTIEQLAYRTNISVENIKILINYNCIPTYSHHIVIKSYFETIVFGAAEYIDEEKYYYNASLIGWINKAEIYRKNFNLSEIANKIKADFIKELRIALLEVEGANLRFEYCFDQNNQLIERGIDQWMSEQWGYVIDGTYGVCLKEISAKNIVIKAVAVRLLEKWVNTPESDISESDRKEISRVLKNYDSVASMFGPHEISKSTRGRLYNRLT